MKNRMVVVTTDKDRRGVFFGEFVRYENETVTLKNAQMAVYWSTKTGGILGLASIGPQKGSKISPIVPRIELNGVTSVIDATKEAAEKWRLQEWG